MEQDIFVNFSEMTLEEIKELIIKQQNQVENKINGVITEQEKENDGFLFWNCKMLLRNIYMACDKIVNKYQNDLTELEVQNYSKMSNTIKEDEKKWNGMESIKETFFKLSSESTVDDEKNTNNLSQSNENEKGFIRKYKTDGTEEEVEISLPNLKVNLPFSPEESKYFDKISKLLDLPILQLKEFSKPIPEINAIYYYNSGRGGKSVIVSKDGSYLAAGSATSFDRLLEEYKNGRRNGDFNKNNTIKISCHSCGNEMEIDTSKLPKNIKTLDTMCPNCKSFIKYGNPNYDEVSSDFDILEISAIEKVGLPTQQHENTNLFVSNDYFVVDNNRYDLSETNKHEIDYFVKNNYSKLKKICEEQTPEFLSKHIAFNNISKMFYLKSSNEDIKINYQTGTESDNFVKKLIDDIISIAFSKINNTKEQSLKIEKKEEYTQEQLKEFYYHQMTDVEKEKIKELNLDNEILKIEKPQYHVKYIDSVGYVFIGEGYLILDNGTEPIHYFANIYQTSSEAKHKILTDSYQNLSEKEKEEFANAYNQDINNINKKLDEARSYIFSKTPNYEKAKEILEDFISGANMFDNDSATETHNFNDVIEFVLYTKKYKSNKDIKWIDIPFSTAYSYLAYIYNEEKRYNDAISMIEKWYKWNPMDLGALFEKTETYKFQKKLDEFKKETELIYEKIYDSRDLAKYYRNLGYYYIENQQLNLAYALYTASLKFERNQVALNEMAYINQQLNRQSYNMSAEEGLQILKQNNIPFGPLQENINDLTSLYQDKELISKPQVEALLASKIYYLTKDKRFSPFIELIDKTTGCSIIVPRSWKPVKEEKRKEQFRGNNMFAVYTDNNSVFQANYDGKCSKEQFSDAYKLNINNMVNNKEIKLKLLKEGVLTLKLQQGVKEFHHALFDITTNDKIVRMIHYFTLINDIFVDFSITLDEKIDFNDENKFNTQKNMIDIINLLGNIIELPLENNNQKTDNNSNNINVNNNYKDINLKEIYESFSTSEDIELLKENINIIIPDDKKDPFWNVSAREVLFYIIIKDHWNSQANYSNFLNIFSTIDSFTKYLKDSNSDLENSSETGEINKRILGYSNNMIESFYNIICTNCKLNLNNNEKNSYELIYSNLHFGITCDKNIGELTHPNDNTYKIGNKITILYGKCNEIDLLKKRANEWLEKSANTNNQTILEELDKEYKLNNDQFNVFEKVVIKNGKKRYYKFVYYNQSMLIFGYNDLELSDQIDKIIPTLKILKIQNKVERNPFNNPKSSNGNSDLNENNDLYKIIKNTVVNEEQSTYDLITKALEKIVSLPFEQETSIAELVNYNPETNFIEPILQGKIRIYVMNICKEYGINIIEDDKTIGGLAFYLKFKKTKLRNSKGLAICPNCESALTSLMPDGRYLYCHNCKKHYINDNGVAGAETSAPPMKPGVLY